MKLAGFVKLRNEILREGNLYRLLDQLAILCDGGVICDDASTDGTADVIAKWIQRSGQPWRLIRVPLKRHDFMREILVKQVMLDALHKCQSGAWQWDWIVWLDGDELFEARAERELHGFLHNRGHEADIWACHYTQIWRSAGRARVDSGFDSGWFWKIWRYRKDLAFELDSGKLHCPQFPRQYAEDAVASAIRDGDSGRAKRLPFEILHLGNWGKNLAWKAIQYRNTGHTEQASLKRHLRFGRVELRDVDLRLYPPGVYRQLAAEEDMSSREYTPQEREIFERMGDLRQREGLFVVIVPTYNRGYALRQTLGSLVKQTDKHWIAIVLDDGSTDDTPALMRELQEADPRIFYARYQENRGGVAMNEIGMDLACDLGEYWVRLGSDDFFEPHKLALDRIAFEAEGDAGAVYGPYRNYRDEAGVEMTTICNPPGDATNALRAKDFAASWANIAMRTDVLRAVKEKFGAYCHPDLRNMEDYIFNVRVSQFEEFVWRGIVDNRLVIGAHSAAEVGVPVNELAARIRHDAVWRVGPDGASSSSMTAVANKDLARTKALFEEEGTVATVLPRPSRKVIMRPWIDAAPPETTPVFKQRPLPTERKNGNGNGHAQGFPVHFPLALRGRLEGMGLPRVIPWEMIEPHEKQAEFSHGADLQTIAARGGLSPLEIVALFECKPSYALEGQNDATAGELLLKKIEAFENER